MTQEHDHFWDIIADMPACMLVTADENLLRARPLAPFVDKPLLRGLFPDGRDSVSVITVEASQAEQWDIDKENLSIAYEVAREYRSRVRSPNRQDRAVQTPTDENWDSAQDRPPLDSPSS